MSANASMIGNWRLHKVKGKFESEGVIVMRGLRTQEDRLFSDITLASITCFSNLVTINLVPLQSPLYLSIFRIKIIGAPILSRSSCFFTKHFD